MIRDKNSPEIYHRLGIFYTPGTTQNSFYPHLVLLQPRKAGVSPASCLSDFPRVTKLIRKGSQENFTTKEDIPYLSKKVSKASWWRVFCKTLTSKQNFERQRSWMWESFSVERRRWVEAQGVHGTGQCAWAGVLGCTDG